MTSKPLTQALLGVLLISALVASTKAQDDSPAGSAEAANQAARETTNATGIPRESTSAGSATSDSTATAPDMGRYMNMRTYDCLDVSYNCFDLLPEFYFADLPDTVYALLDFWRDMCGPGEPILRARILTDIWTSQFSEDVYGTDIIDHLLWFQLKMSDVTSPWPSYLWKNPYYAPSPAEDLEALIDYDEFMADLADQLLPHAQPGSLESLYCLFYSGQPDTVFQLLKTDALRGTKLRQAYDADVARLRRVTDLDIAGSIGYWQPQGGLATIGPKPTLGGLIGISGNWWVGRLAGALRLGTPDEQYVVEYLGEQTWVDHYFGVYVGAEGGFRLLRSRHHAFDILGGVGYDGFEAIPSSDVEEGKWLNSPNLNATAATRFYFGSQSEIQISLELRYEKTYYDNTGGSDLSGDAWSLQLVFGWSGDKWRNRRLNALHTDRWEK